MVSSYPTQHRQGVPCKKLLSDPSCQAHGCTWSPYLASPHQGFCHTEISLKSPTKKEIKTLAGEVYTD